MFLVNNAELLSWYGNKFNEYYLFNIDGSNIIIFKL